MGIEEALLRVPLLLPICGHAQSIAAQRAASAARGQAEPWASQHISQLWREQGLAAAWRFAIDWPPLVGRERDIALLKAVQQAIDPESLATLLLDFLPGLISAEDTDELTRWVDRSDCTAAVVIRRARELETGLPVKAPELVAGEQLQGRALAALSAERFDPLTPEGAGIEVGPLAMRRQPLVERLKAGERYGALSRRLLAQALDTLVIAGHLLDERSTYPLSAWPLAPRVGMGRAMTARGPVFHRIALAEDDSVADWRVLAPTDWHFAPDGPLAREAQLYDTHGEALGMLVAGFDPCAPWTIEEAAHA